METIIIKNAPLVQKRVGKKHLQRTLELFATLDKLQVMDLLTVKNEMPLTIRNIVCQYKKNNRKKDFITRIQGDDILIQRI
jgi:hypothetical protein